MITLSNPRDPVVLGAGGRWRPKEKNTIFCTTPKSDSLLVGHLIRWPSESDIHSIWPEDWQAGETLCIFGIGASADKTDKATGLEQCSIGVARPVLHRRSACAFLLPPSLSSSQNWALRRPAAGAARSFSRQIKQQLHEEERLPYGLHPPLLSSHQHQKQTPPPETTTSSTRFTSTSTNIKPSVTSSCLWAMTQAGIVCWMGRSFMPLGNLPYSFLLSIQ